MLMGILYWVCGDNKVIRFIMIFVKKIKEQKEKKGKFLEMIYMSLGIFVLVRLVKRYITRCIGQEGRRKRMIRKGVEELSGNN